MTVLPRTPHQTAWTVCLAEVSVTPTTNVVGIRLKLGGAWMPFTEMPSIAPG